MANKAQRNLRQVFWMLVSLGAGKLMWSTVQMQVMTRTIQEDTISKVPRRDGSPTQPEICHGVLSVMLQSNMIKIDAS